MLNFGHNKNKLTPFFKTTHFMISETFQIQQYKVCLIFWNLLVLFYEKNATSILDHLRTCEFVSMRWIIAQSTTI